MVFNKVFKSLLELFPQIDARALRAVAIEHSKDPDAAVEAVLEEIIPFFTGISIPARPLSWSGSANQSLKEAVAAEQSVDISTVDAIGPAAEICANNLNRSHNANDENDEPFYDNYNKQHDGEGELPLSDKFSETSTILSADTYSHGQPAILMEEHRLNSLQGEASVHHERTETISAGKCPETGIENSSVMTPRQTSEHPGNEHVDVDQILNQVQERDEFDCNSTAYIDNETCKENDHGTSCTDGSNSVDDIVSEAVPNLTTSISESIVQVVVLPDVDGSNFESFEVSFPSDFASKMQVTDGNGRVEEESTTNESVSQSSQILSMSVLEEYIGDARNYKKTLFSAMENVISLMREVELKEQAAEEAKEEAANGGTNLLDKVEELKQMLKRAKEANDMHAGEVYGEKSILATELRELQSRVLYLSDERDKSLAVLDEMRQTLEMRLATAENEINSAKQEKVINQISARKALSDQERIMEEVVEESNILKQQAEENAKLQEFLVARGCVLDTLQGEIAVVSQDVKLLKTKIDDFVPLSKPHSSCLTGSIASSSSLLKSSSADQVEPVPVLEDSVQNRQLTYPVTRVSVEEDARYDRETLLEEGWDFFDNLEK